MRVLVVDDERWARRRIVQLLRDEPGIDLVGECESGAAAVAEIAERVPDLVFLDIQLPDLDGFDVIAAVGSDRMPSVIFVTAHEQYAIRAFDAHAVDYLVKPFDAARFHRALERARRETSTEPVRHLLDAVGRRYAERVVVRDAGRVTVVKVEGLDWIEAAANYVALHVDREVHLIRETMAAFERRLDPARFARVHRSAIVNLERVKALREWVLVLADGTELRVGRAFRDRLARLR
jgi:two-component system LytT family response regulator